MGLLSGIGKLVKGAVNIYKGSQKGIKEFEKTNKVVALTFPDIGKSAVSKAVPIAKKVFSVVGKVAKALVPTSTKGKIIAGVSAPVVIGALAREPKAVIQKVAKAPSELAQFGGDVATFAVDPSLEKGKNIVKNSPIISAGAGLLGAGGLGKVVAPFIGGYLQKEAIDEQTEVLKEIGGYNVIDKSQQFTTQPFKQPVNSEQPVNPGVASPVMPQVKEVSPGIPRTRKKKRKMQVPSSINQNVNVVVQNRNNNVGLKLNKTFIKNEAFV
jgi:hypothetical protein